jgi:Reverse transcriptase (RNA-dependent DNA polymerase).
LKNTPLINRISQSFGVSALKQLDPSKSSVNVPPDIQQLIQEFPSLLTPNFKNIKHQVEHSIHTKDSAQIHSKARPLLPGSPKAVNGKKAWDEMVKLGIVEKVSATEQHYYSSPLHLQTKSDGSERPCGDFRLLNEQTLPDVYQLPNLNNFTSNIKRSNFFSKVDLVKAFHFIPIRDQDQLKCCVNTPWGLFKFKRLAFGLRNAPASFQKFADEVFKDIPNVYVYLDDCLVFTDSYEEHIKTLRQIFQRLSEYGLAIALPKCAFAQPTVDFLGYKVDNSGVTPLKHKTQCIDKFPTPSTQKQLLRF